MIKQLLIDRLSLLGLSYLDSPTLSNLLPLSPMSTLPSTWALSLLTILYLSFHISAFYHH